MWKSGLTCRVYRRFRVHDDVPVLETGVTGMAEEGRTWGMGGFRLHMSNTSVVRCVCLVRMRQLLMLPGHGGIEEAAEVL